MDQNHHVPVDGLGFESELCTSLIKDSEEQRSQQNPKRIVSSNQGNCDSCKTITELEVEQDSVIKPHDFIDSYKPGKSSA